MKIVLMIVLALISGCDDIKSPRADSNEGAAAIKLLSHGDRKYTYNQFGSANKAYLEAFFVYKDSGLTPLPQLYLGLSALIIQQLRETHQTYPFTVRMFIINDEKELVVHNEKDLLNASLKYLLAAKELSKDRSPAEIKSLKNIISCHESRMLGNTDPCDLVDRDLFAFKLE